MASSPLVTILITNHNYACYLRAAIDSALGQSYPRIEVIVVDDGSTDASRSILEEYGSRIVSILKDQGGQASALNVGFRALRGDYVCLLDADDLFAPDKVSRVLDGFVARPSAGWVYHEMDYIDGDGCPLSPDQLADQNDVRTLRERRIRYRDITNIDLRDSLRSGKRLPYACPAISALSFRRAALAEVMPIPETIARASDEFPKIAALALFPGVHLGTVLALQRIHGNNAATGCLTSRLDASVRYLNTAYHLRSRFAEVAPSADNWFARSFGEVIGVRGVRRALEHPEGRQYIARFFTLSTWLRQGLRIAFHAVRIRFRQMRGSGICP